MLRNMIVVVALAALAVTVYAAASETFSGVASATGTYKRPLLIVDGKRYELKASDQADATVAEVLTRFSKGDTGAYVVTGARGLVNGVDGILVDRIAPAGASTRPSPAGRTAGGAATAPSTPAGAGGKDPRKYTSYDYAESGKNLRLTLPDGLPTVRGILVVGPGAGGDSRELYREPWYREFMHLHGFAFLGTQAFSSHAENFRVMQNALKQFAQDAHHPELVNAPYAATGFSAGGGFASRLLVEVPDKVIASVIVGSRLKLTEISPTAAHLGTPACIINGEHEDNGMAAVVEPVLAAYRPKGALFGWMAVPGGGHSRSGQEVLAMPLLDAAVRLRYPADADVRKGPVKLKALDPDTGWIADNTTWKSGLTRIVPASQFKGDVAKSSWLPTEDVAFIYRAYATYDRPLRITSPRNASSNAPDLAWDPGSSVTIGVDDSRFAGWKKLEFYDGARKLGEITEGPAQFAAKDLDAGYHAFSVLGTDAKGAVRPSDPVLVVVRTMSAAPWPAAGAPSDTKSQVRIPGTPCTPSRQGGVLAAVPACRLTCSWVDAPGSPNARLRACGSRTCRPPVAQSSALRHRESACPNSDRM